jgi:hypothetical protein
MAAIKGDHTDEVTPPCDGPHKWAPWEVIGYTGDWFHPHIVKRTCKNCGAAETDEH